MITKKHIQDSGKKLAIATLFTAVSVLAFASMGGGGGKKKNASLLRTPTFTPFRPGASPFTLKSNVNYRGGQVLTTQQDGKFVMHNSVVTYRNGNTVHIFPTQQKVVLQKFKTPTPAPHR